MPAKDLTGQRFGRLVVVKRGANYVIPSTGKKVARWWCECDCATSPVANHAPRSILVTGGDLRSRHSKSCGCWKREATALRSTKHGAARKNRRSRLYETWLGIKSRVLNPRNTRFANYGERGIRMHEPWINDFARFRDDLLNEIGERPTPQHSLDRIDNDGHYEPGNIHWALLDAEGNPIQPNNKGDNHLITFNGETLTLAQWGRRLAPDHPRPSIFIYTRLWRGWTEEQAVTIPLGSRR